MMIRAGMLALLIQISCDLVPQALAASDQSALVVYVYESFLNASLRERISQQLKVKTGHGVKWVETGDAAQVVARHQLDLRRGHVKAQVLVGIDAATFSGVKEDALSLTEKELPELQAIRPELRKEPRFIPFNFGVQAFVVDTARLPEALWPRSWDDLLRPELQAKLLLEDPRTSTPGLGFLIASREVWGEAWSEKWKRLRRQWLTLTPGWTQAYGLFQKAEAPLVWSYTTSQAYHQLSDPPSKRYRALIFREGNPVQVEGLIVSKEGTKDPGLRKAALVFASLLLGEAVQREVPRAQWMNPARLGVSVPWGSVSPQVPNPVREIELPWMTGTRELLKLWSDAIR